MKSKRIFILGASCLIAAAGLAIAQPQSAPARQSLQTAERLAQMRVGLVDAIATAERHSRGTAIGARISTNWTPFQQESLGYQTRGQQTMGQADRERFEREVREANPNLTREQITAQAQDRWQTDALVRIEREILEQNPKLTREQAAAEARKRIGAQSHEPSTRGVSDGSNTAGSRVQGTELQDSRDGSLFAVITCVVDQTRVREVIVDMKANTIVGVYAADALRDGTSADDSSAYQREAGHTLSAANVRASDLMNATARDAQGNRVGDIDELAIDPESNRVVYAVLQRGGFLGMGESRYAIPTSELSIPHEGRMHLSLTKNDFEGQSGFDNNNWPLRADAQWGRTAPVDNTPAPNARRIVKATDIIGSGVKCSDGESLGEIKDLIVEPRSGRIVYAIIDSKNGYLPIPMPVLTAKGDGYTIPMTMEEVRAKKTMQGNSDPNWNDTAWNRANYEGYGLKIDERTPSRDQPRDRRTNER